MKDLTLYADTRRLLQSYQLTESSFETIIESVRESMPVQLPDVRGTRERFAGLASSYLEAFRKAGREGICAVWEKGGRLSFCVYDRLFWRNSDEADGEHNGWVEACDDEELRVAFEVEVRLGEGGGARVGIWADLESSFDAELSLPCAGYEADEDLVWALEGMAWRCSPLSTEGAKLAAASPGLDLAGTMTAALDNLPSGIALYGVNAKPIYQNGMAKTLLESGVETAKIDCEELVSRVLVTGESYTPTGQEQNFQVKIQKEDRFFRPFIIPLFTQNGERAGALLSLVDTTGQQLIADLESDFLGSVSHELKGPLTSIRMAILLLHDGGIGELNTQQLDLVETAKEEVERLIRTLRSLLDVQRAKHGQSSLDQTIVMADELLATSASEMRRGAESRGMRFQIERNEENATAVIADKERLVHVLNIFVSNAIKYSKEGSEISLSAATTESGKVRFAVKDSGSGIAPKNQQRIFNSYVRGINEDQPGLGLGLALARDLVQAHGGRIGVESKEGEGSVFFFEIPAANQISV